MSRTPGLLALCAIVLVGLTGDAGARMRGSDSAESPAITVDTRGSGSSSAESAPIVVDTSQQGARPVIQDVQSWYCNNQQHAYFLHGISLNLSFEASVNWNGKTPGALKFNGVSQAWPDATRGYDVGCEFGVDGKLIVRAVAADGTESLPYAANFDVIAPPPGFPTAIMQPPSVGLGGTLTYTVPYGVDWDLFDEGIDAVPTDNDGEEIPGFSFQPLRFVTDTIGSARVGGDGTAAVDLELVEWAKFKAGGMKFAPVLNAYPVWTYMPGTKEWRLGGTLYLGLNGKGKTIPCYIWWLPPIYLRGELAVSLGAQLGIVDWSAAGAPVLGGDFTVGATAYFVAGCGAADLLAVEGYIGGGPVFTLQFPAEPTLAELGIHLEGGVRVVLLFFEFDSGWLDYTWWLIGGDSRGAAELTAMQAAMAAQLNKPDGAVFKPLPRDYLGRDYAEFTGKRGFWDRRMREEGGGISVAAEAPIQLNVYPFSDPALAANDPNRMLLWVWDNPARSTNNRAELVWSRWTGSGFTNPTSVWDEGTADFAPELGLFTNGVALAAWQNLGSILSDDAGLDEALAGLEIASGHFDPVAGAWVSSNLTDNAYLDRSPKLAVAENGTALLTWIANPANNANGSAAEPNTIRSRFWDGASWRAPVSVATNAGMLLWSCVAWNGADGAFVATLDADDDLSSVEDQELYGAMFDGSGWTPLSRLTTNGVSDAKPQAVYDSAGNLLLAWCQGSNIVTAAGGLDLQAPTVAGHAGESSAARDFVLAAGPAGQISMVWADTVEGGPAPEPFMLNYDPALAAWSATIRLLEDTNHLERAFSAAYATNGSLLLAYNRVAVSIDTNGVPRPGSSDLMFMDYLIGGDLGVEASGIGFSTNPAPGRTVDVSIAIQNLGELAATNVQAALYAGDPAGGGALIGATQTVAGVLAAGASTNVQVTWGIPVTSSNITLYALVDPALAQEDRNRANNTATLSVLAPDLEIEGMSVIRNATNARLINARAINTGSIPTPSPAEITFRRGGTNGPVLGTAEVSVLATGAQYDACIEWNMSAVVFTSAFELVYAIVDEAGAVAEGGENNNIRFCRVVTALDTDGDGLLDGDEEGYGTSPILADTDGDGLTDGAEVNIYGTSPTLADTDGDGSSDGHEVAAGTDPHSATDVFKIVSAEGVTTNYLLCVRWNAVSGSTYRVEMAPALVGFVWTNAPDGAGPQEQSTQTAGSNGVLRYYDTTPALPTNRFYRIRIAP